MGDGGGAAVLRVSNQPNEHVYGLQEGGGAQSV